MRKKLFKAFTGLCAVTMLTACSAGIFALAEEESKISAVAEIPLFSVSDEQSSVSYGAFDGAPLAEGVKVELAEGDELKYNRPINVSSLRGDALVDICVVPEEVGNRDVSSLQVILTDVYDETNQVIIDIHDMTFADRMAYAHAKAKNQDFVGLENGLTYWRNSSYGQWCYMSFAGDSQWVQIDSPEKNRISLAYNDETKQVNFYQYSLDTVFADFDDPNYYTELWDGFTTGDVLLSVKCGNYSTATAKFVMMGVVGHDITPATFSDKEAPVISIAAEEDLDEANVPKAVIGKPYPIFDTLVMDSCDGYLNTTARVYQNYYMVKRTAVTVNQQAFVPLEEDVYYIEYTATDSFGNVSKKVVEVEAVEETAALDVTFAEAATTGTVGVEFVLPEYAYQGGTGKLAVTETVTVAGKEYPIHKDEISGEKTIRPYEAGTYKYNVTVTDRVGQTTTESYEIVVTASDAAVFIEPASLPKYFIVGETYNLPVIPAYDFTSGTQKEVATKIYEVIGSNEKEIVGGVYTPTTAGAATIVYKAMNGTVASSIDYDAQIVDTSNGKGGIALNKFFYTEDEMTIETSSNGTTLSTTSGTNRADFINPLSIVTNSFEISVPDGETGFLKLNVYFTNYYDTDQVLKYTFENRGGGAVMFYLNDDRTAGRTLTWKLNGLNNEVKMDWTNKLLFPDATSGIQVKVNKYMNGEAVDFDLLKGIGYMSIEIEEASSKSTVSIRSICGEMMRENTKDTQLPSVYLPYQQLGSFVINETFTILPALAIDVLDPTIQSYLTVKGPDGKTATSKNNVLLDKVPVDQVYEFELNQYGVYRVIYYAADGTGNANTTSGLILEVVDQIAPEMTIECAVATRIELGQAIYIPTMTAVDNVDETNVKTLVQIIATSGEVYDFSDGSYNGFKPAETGVYYLRYTAMDSAGNIAQKVFRFEVVAPQA